MSMVGDYVFSTTLVLWVATVLGRGKAWAHAAVSSVLRKFSASIGGLHIGSIDTIFTVAGLLIVLAGGYALVALPAAAAATAPAVEKPAG